MKRAVKVTLTHAEATALLVVAGEGYIGIGTNDEAMRSYLGGVIGLEAAQRAITKIKLAQASAS